MEEIPDIDYDAKIQEQTTMITDQRLSTLL